MADGQDQDGQDAIPVEREARMMGWVPREEFKGPEDAWVDADAFVEKGRQILPIVQKNNERLVRETASLQDRLARMEESVRSANAVIEALQESHAKDVEAQVAEARAELKAQLATANEAGDHAGVAEITDKLIQLNAADKKAGGSGEGKNGKGANGSDNQQFQMHPEVQVWFSQNKEFIQNSRKMALAHSIMVEKRQAGDTRVGQVILDEIAQEVNSILDPGTGQRGVNKVEGSNGGRGRSSGGKSYADLPADAKAVCDRMAGKLVGPNRAHKDVASWRAKYAEKYFGEGA